MSNLDHAKAGSTLDKSGSSCCEHQLGRQHEIHENISSLKKENEMIPYQNFKYSYFY